MLRSGSSAVLLFLPPLLCAIWIVAAGTHAIPTGEWGVHEGNHGPWRYAYDLREALWLAFRLPWIACAGAMTAAVFAPRAGAIGLVIASIASYAFLLASHYWLID